MSLAPMSLIDEVGLRQLEEFAKRAPMGDFVEVGVFKGGSAYRLYNLCQKQGRTLHLFDTFNGIPFVDDIDDAVKPGHFHGNYESVLEMFPDAKIYKGVFPKTMPNDMRNIAFVHVDCDIYRTTRDIIELLPPIMVTGGMLYFDDYGNLNGGKKAVNEGLKDFVVMEQRAVWYKR